MEAQDYRPQAPKPAPQSSHAARLWELLAPHRAVMLWSVGLLLVNRASGLVLPGALGYLVDHVMARHEPGAMARVLELVLAATLLQAGTDLFLGLGLGRAGQAIIAEMRLRVQHHVIRLPMAFFDRERVGAVAGRVMADAGGLRDLVGVGSVETLGSVMTGVLAAGWLLHLSVRLTVPLLAALLLGAAGLHRISGGLQGYFHSIRQLQAQITGRLTESIAGVRVVKGYAAEAREAAVFAAGVCRLEQAENVENRAQGFISLAGTWGVLAVGIATIAAATREVVLGRMTVGDFAAYIVLAGYAGVAARQMGGLRGQVAASFAALDRTDALLAEPAESLASAGPASFAGVVTFDEVDFAYAPGEAVLEDVSFEARPGTVTALVGSSGSGKSTIAALVCGFYPAAGVLVDDVPLLARDLGGYRAGLGVVSQAPFLFSGSIRENVLFGRPAASEAEMLEACRLAHVDAFVMHLPQGYDTPAGERGVRLSGGEQQRICLARAILADPRVLVLDEATGSLDAESEAFIGQSMQALCAGRTVFVIAHRMSSVRLADQILVVEGGRIVERGTHEELVGVGGRYFELYRRQVGVGGEYAHDNSSLRFE